MTAIRIIPRLDIKGENLVKGIHLEGLRILGRPEAFAQYYYAQGADELLFMDAVASLYGRNSLLPIVERTARDLFIPLTVGGGLRSLQDFSDVLSAGADKVAVNTAAVERPALIAEAAERFGSSTIVVGIDAKRAGDGDWHVFTGNGRDKSSRRVLDWAQEAAQLGAGEILLTSIDQEGTGGGYDIALTRLIAAAVDIPVIACGGAGSAGDVVRVLSEGQADAVTCAAMFHYAAVSILGSGVGEESTVGFRVLAERRDYGRVQPTGIPELKRALCAAGYSMRMIQDDHGAPLGPATEAAQ